MVARPCMGELAGWEAGVEACTQAARQSIPDTNQSVAMRERRGLRLARTDRVTFCMARILEVIAPGRRGITDMTLNAHPKFPWE
jgi:hypothetical protein